MERQPVEGYYMPICPGTVFIMYLYFHFWGVLSEDFFFTYNYNQVIP